MTPTEFELYCMEVLNDFAKESGIKCFHAEHNQRITADDGTYQIDILASAYIMRINVKIICECKRYRRPIEREKVLALFNKVQSLGANIGILMSTSPFQRGAIQYALRHGIKLIQLCDPDNSNGTGGGTVNKPTNPVIDIVLKKNRTHGVLGIVGFKPYIFETIDRRKYAIVVGNKRQNMQTRIGLSGRKYNKPFRKDR